jgi:plastocyanin
MVRVLSLLMLVVVAPASFHPTAPLKPDLVVFAARAVQTCVGQARSYDIRVVVANRGNAPSPARLDAPIVAVADSSRPARWSAIAGLPAIPVNGSVAVLLKLAQTRPGVATVPVMPLIVTVNSGRWIDESNFDNDGAQIASVAPAGCAAIAPTTLGAKANTANVTSVFHLPPNSIVLQAPPRPPLHPQPVPANFIAPPTALTYTTDPTVCVNHVGLVGAFVCQQAISRAGLLLLIWNWAPCNAVGCLQQIQGYHIYQAPPGGPAQAGVNGTVHPITPIGAPLQPLHNVTLSRTPVDTQSNPGTTLRGISPYRKGECFVVTAYGYGHESDDSNTFCVGAAAFITAPWNLRYATSYEIYLNLEWNWTPCLASTGCAQNVDGFNVYKTGGAFVMQQPDSTHLDVDLSGFNVGTCYVVRAYRGNVQSDPSSPFCVTQQMMPTPSPRPTAPAHVDIDVPDDKYPNNTIVHVGGSVTWKNDDTDEHNVVSDDSSIVGDLPPGGSFTYTFPRVGTIRYHCDFHQGMQGTITVVAH